MQRILTIAIIAGVLAGFLNFSVQQVKLVPLILAAEEYENAAEDDHHHADRETAEVPLVSLERTAYTLLTDVGIGVGFALILVGLFVLRGEKPDAQRGLLWGLAGFAVFSLAPSFGLPPELPTTFAADLYERQTWWLLTALATACGLYSLCFAENNALKIVGAALIAAPHIIGAPVAPLGGAVPTELNAQFAAASLVSSGLFWLALGLACSHFYNRFTDRTAQSE